LSPSYTQFIKSVIRNLLENKQIAEWEKRVDELLKKYIQLGAILSFTQYTFYSSTLSPIALRRLKWGADSVFGAEHLYHGIRLPRSMSCERSCRLLSVVEGRHSDFFAQEKITNKAFYLFFFYP